MTSLKVHSIFTSVSGEVGGITQGSWVTFIRLDGCNLRCNYCDTKETQEGVNHTTLEVDEIIHQVRRRHCQQVLITGGEPLLQMEAMEFLCAELHTTPCCRVSVETNGSLLPSEILSMLVDHWIVDFKLPESGVCEAMMSASQFNRFPFGTWIKFVCQDRVDYALAKGVWRELSKDGASEEFKFAFSACPPLQHNQLFQWMREDRLYDCIFNVQIHKLAKLEESS